MKSSSLAGLGAMCAFSIAVPAGAATLAVQVRDARGAAVPNAVVTVHLTGRPTPGPRVAGPYVIQQRNIQFDPFVTIVPAGADVAFPNRDMVRHHVYSFSPVKKFELKLYAREDNRTVQFDKPGVVPLGCNIHDAMTAFIVVVDTAWAAKTDASGVARFAGLPGGAADIDVWHPYLRTPGNHLGRPVQLGASESHAESFAVTLRMPPKPSANY